MAEASAPGRPVRMVAGTIVSRGYLPAARVLTETYLRHHPESGVRILLLDATDEDMAALPALPGDVEIIRPDRLDLPLDEFYRMAAAYTVTELATALKPSLLRYLLRQAPVAVYLDPDIQVFAPFDEVAELAQRHGIVLTPHVTEPMPRDGLRPTEADIMASGVFNLGFVAVSSAAQPFLDFWAERLRQDALVAPAEQMFTDQRWVDNVPALFNHFVLSDPGFNVAYWNVYQRPIVRADGPDALTAAGKPLRFFHFSGFRPEKPWLMSTHFSDRPRVLLSEHPELARLCADYRERLLAAGYGSSLDAVPYRFNTLPDGTKLSGPMRRTYRDAWVAAERKGEQLPPSPFAPGGAEPFLEWAARPADPAQRAAGSTTWAMAVWQARADLQQAYPEPLGADAEGYRAWCASSGLAEGELHPRAVPGPPPSRAVPVSDEPGINLLGYLSAELGVGEMGRIARDAATLAGLPVATVVEENMVANRTEHPVPVARNLPPKFPITLLCVNADMTEPTVGLYPELINDRYVIGLWSWELSVFPEWMHAAFAHVDEVWTISEFCRAAIAAEAPVPVRTFPVPVRDPYAATGRPEVRREPGRPTTFLFAFDYNSLFERKNPLAAVRAFLAAFGDRTDVRLVIKSINGEDHPADRERLRLAVSGDARIELIERYLSNTEIGELFGSADCYVSLHRSEGFGLTVAEAMSRGLPVIATDYGGSAAVLTGETGWPIGYTLIPVGPGSYPYPPGAEWADPDLDAAAAAMRAVADDPVAARERGEAARRHVLATRSFAAAGEWVARQVAQARQAWQRPRMKAPRDDPADPRRALSTAREALLWRPDVHAPSRLPFASALRGAVLRAIDHYDFHQRTVLGAVVDSVEDGIGRLYGTIGEVQRQQDESAADIRASEAEALTQERAVAALTARLDDLETRLAAHTAEGDRMAARLDDQQDRITGLRNETQRIGARAEETARRARALDVAVIGHHERLAAPPAAGRTALVPSDVGMLGLPADDRVVLPWLRYYACWEPEESQLVDHLLAPGDGFVDIGAHVGYFTLRALRRVGPSGAVFAVEPWAPARELLSYNVRANLSDDLGKALTVVPAAAWDAAEGLRLRAVEPGNSGDHRVSVAGQGELVDGVRLDELAPLRERRIRMVKCDAQGQDHRALAGLAAVLRRDRPHVLCEFWPAAITASGGDPVAVLRRYRGWHYDLLPVTESLVRDVQAGRPVEAPDGEDWELVRGAERESTGFLTLWLRPNENAADNSGEADSGE